MKNTKSNLIKIFIIVKRYIEKADIIFLSHSEREYVGALYFLFTRFECNAKVFSTVPVADHSIVNIFNFFLSRFRR